VCWEREAKGVIDVDLQELRWAREQVFVFEASCTYLKLEL
jgi:hypothetical protein